MHFSIKKVTFCFFKQLNSVTFVHLFYCHSVPMLFVGKPATCVSDNLAVLVFEDHCAFPLYDEVLSGSSSLLDLPGVDSLQSPLILDDV